MPKSRILEPHEKVSGRSFSDPRHIHADMRRMRHMVRQLIDQYHDPAVCDYVPGKRPVCSTDAKGRHFRIYYIHPALLFSHAPLTVVGFFGHRRHGADIAPLLKADRRFAREFDKHPGLLSLSTVRLVDGNFGNLVLFTDEEAKQRWGNDPVHRTTVAEVSPPYYSFVRLCNGVLDEGLASPHDLVLQRVRYLDYRDTPTWRATRVMDGA